MQKPSGIKQNTKNNNKKDVVMLNGLMELLIILTCVVDAFE